MAPLKARIWAKMAENRGEIAQRIRNLNGFSDRKTGEKNRQGARTPDACTEHVVDPAGEPVKTVAHCCPQKGRQQTRTAEQRRSAGPSRNSGRMCGWPTGCRGESSRAVLPPCQPQAVTVQHFVMVLSQLTLECSCAPHGDGRGDLRRDERVPGSMRKETGRSSGVSSSPVLLSCQLNGTSLLDFVEISRQDQTGISEVDGMEHGDAASRLEAGEVVDPSTRVTMTDLPLCTPTNGRRRPKERSRYTWKTGLGKRIPGFETKTWNQSPVIGPRSQRMRSRMRLCARLGCQQTTMFM